MITIQGFARLCGCNTQTLRYYDRIGLLTPARVDEWTGYRYYEEEQAVQFVKIKNLQQADFSIEEIRPLLSVDDSRLMEAFERKIEEQQHKLEQIRKIQRSYLKETMEMQKMVNTVIDFVEAQTGNPALWQEFGLDDSRQAEVSAQVHEMLAGWLEQCRNAGPDIAGSVKPEDTERLKAALDRLTGGDAETVPAAAEQSIPEGAEPVFTRDGWEHVSEWIGELPDLDDGKQDYCVFRVREDSPAGEPGFQVVMLAVMGTLYHAMNGGMNCTVSRSNDGQNHFTLYRK